MNNYEFLEYKTYTVDLNDPKTNFNPQASAMVRIDRKYVVIYFLKTFKDKPPFWAPISASVRVNGESKYLDGFMADSRSEEKAILEFIKENVRRVSANNSGLSYVSPELPLNISPSATSGGASDEPIPF